VLPGEDVANPATDVGQLPTGAGLGGESPDGSYIPGADADTGVPDQTGAMGGYGDNTTDYTRSGGECDDPGFGKEGGRNKPTVGQKIKGTSY
jgi:hypothetical protein